jgi:hypothetical protein
MYLKIADSAQPSDVNSSLWTDEAMIMAYFAHDDKYQAAIMEQYKLYVEMADRISIPRFPGNLGSGLHCGGTPRRTRWRTRSGPYMRAFAGHIQRLE